MSEYQYYEFLAIDKSLSQQQMNELRSISTRVQITPSSFINKYHWGDLKADPVKMLEKYFDAFYYYANWGTRIFAIKIPKSFIDYETVLDFCCSESASAREKGNDIIIYIETGELDEYWIEAEETISSVISLHNDLINGDYRFLYLAWLLNVQEYEIDDFDTEPAIPPNLKNLNPSQKNFIKFLIYHMI
jgi:hypothetical protein